MKPIRLSAHAKEQLIFRGTTEEEVIETRLHNGNLQNWEGWNVERILTLKKNGIRSIIRLNRLDRFL